MNELRFSGHESFPCRYGWLPKAHAILTTLDSGFKDEVLAMQMFGLGRNMVKSLRFWAQAFGVSEEHCGVLQPSEWARLVLDPDTGTDPYLEDKGNLWILHWILASRARLAAWDIAFSGSTVSEITRTVFCERIVRLARDQGKEVSESTVKTHYDVFLSTYAHVEKPGFTSEDRLACPLQELRLVSLQTSLADAIICLRKVDPSEIPPRAFATILLDYWDRVAKGESTLAVLSLCVDPQGPVRLLRLKEAGLARLFRNVASAFPDTFEYSDSIERHMLTRHDRSDSGEIAA